MQDDSAVRYGVARRTITPKWPILMGGFAYRHARSSGVHDPLEARCVSLSDGSTRLVIVACDLLWVESETCRGVRAAVKEQHGLAGDHVMIVGTHTHSAPTELSTARGRTAGKTEQAYWQYVGERIIEAVGEALAYDSPGTIEWAESATNIGINRRRKGADGITIGPNRYGTVDRRLGVLTIRNTAGQVDAIIANAACHPTILHGNNLSVSAEFPGVACRILEAEHPGATAMFVQGACADVEPVVCDMGHAFKGEQGTFEDVDLAGRTLAHETLFAMNNPNPVESHTLDASVEYVRLECKTNTDERYYDRMMRGLRRGDYVWDWCADRRAELRRAESPNRAVTVGVQVLSIGSDVRIVGIEGEVFAETAQKIRSSCAARCTFIAGYANGCVGYLPPASAFKEGGYEVEQSAMYYQLPGMLQKNAENRILAAVERCCR